MDMVNSVLDKLEMVLDMYKLNPRGKPNRVISTKAEEVMTIQTKR